MAARTRTRRGFLAALGLGGLIPVTDFPDWNAPQGHATAIYNTGVNAALPVKIAAGGPHPANASWGPDAAVAFPVGASYIILLAPQAPGQAFITDLTVNHLDKAGAVVYTEAFTVSNLSNTGLAGGTTPQAGVLVRGNLHGQQLQCSGLTISQANANTVLGTSVFTIGGVTLTYYAQSYFIPGTRPKVTPLVNTGFLAFAANQTVANGASIAYGVMPGYAGAAFISYRASGASVNALPIISSFTVAGGTTPIKNTWFPQITNTFQEPIQFALDQVLHTVSVNNNGTASGQLWFEIIAKDYT